MSSSMSLSISSSMSSSMSSIPANTTEATKLQKKSVIKQTGGDVKAKTLWKTAMGVIANNLDGVLNSNEIGLDKIQGFAKGYEVGNFETKMEVEVDRKLESEVSGLKNELGKRMDDKSLEEVVNGNEMRLDEIPGFMKGEIEKLAKGLVDKEIEKSAVKALWLFVVSVIINNLDLVDFAMASGDASVKKHSKAYVGGSGACRVTE
uniref:Uncharacterized protein n=1 Tax=Tanacetum cinerariifolium TaxID=118510 RepID=A0A6L2KYQ9_TANCI|nr:hypothetical protein [Tanacetum cinerariifolium]